VFVLPFEQNIVMYCKFHLFQETVSMIACINVLNVDGNHKRKLQVSSDNAKQKQHCVSMRKKSGFIINSFDLVKRRFVDFKRHALYRIL
jgi:hypothetical protein